MSEDGEGPLVLWEKGGDNKTHQTNAVKEIDDILRSMGVVITRHGATQDGDEGPMVTQIMGKDAFKAWAELPAEERDEKAGFECIGSTDIFGAALFETSEQFQVSFEKINDVGKVTPRGGKYMGDAKGHDAITTEHAFKHQSGELYQLEAPLNVPGSKPLRAENRVFLAPLKGLVVMVAYDTGGATLMTRNHDKRLPRVDAVRVDGIFPTTFGSVAHEVSARCSLFLVPRSSFLVPRSIAPLRVLPRLNTTLVMLTDAAHVASERDHGISPFQTTDLTDRATHGRCRFVQQLVHSHPRQPAWFWNANGAASQLCEIR